MGNGEKLNFTFAHTNINVTDLERSVKFYAEALGLSECHRRKAADGSFELVFMTDAAGRHQLELTCLAGRTKPYDLSDNEIHIAFTVEDAGAALKKHRAMGCVVKENGAMGIYFIEDPDGYGTEIIPAR